MALNWHKYPVAHRVPPVKFVLHRLHRFLAEGILGIDESFAPLGAVGHQDMGFYIVIQLYLQDMKNFLF